MYYAVFELRNDAAVYRRQVTGDEGKRKGNQAHIHLTLSGYAHHSSATTLWSKLDGRSLTVLVNGVAENDVVAIVSATCFHLAILCLAPQCCNITGAIKGVSRSKYG